MSDYSVMHLPVLSRYSFLRFFYVRMFHHILLGMLIGAFLGFCFNEIHSQLIRKEFPEVAEADEPDPVPPEIAPKKSKKSKSDLKKFSSPGDGDGDGLNDDWELSYGLDPENSDDAGSDFDRDGLTATQEHEQGTNPNGEWGSYFVPNAIGTYGSADLNNVVALRINDNGHILGSATEVSSQRKIAWIVGPNGESWVAAHPSKNVEPRAFNEYKEIVGCLLDGSSESGFFWSPEQAPGSEFADLADSTGASVFPTGINAVGDVWGETSFGDPVTLFADGSEANYLVMMSIGETHVVDTNTYGEQLLSVRAADDEGKAFVQLGDLEFYSHDFSLMPPIPNNGDPGEFLVGGINDWGDMAGTYTVIEGVYRAWSYTGEGYVEYLEYIYPPRVDINNHSQVIVSGGGDSPILSADGITLEADDLFDPVLGVDPLQGLLELNNAGDLLIETQGGDYGVILNQQDRDGDDMSNDWESFYGLDPDDASDRNLDPDGDGVTNYGEFILRRDPNLVDPVDLSGQVVDIRDGIDWDQDGIPNAWEVTHGLNWEDASDALEDPDRDGYSNLYEFHLDTNPFSAPLYQVVEIAPATSQRWEHMVVNDLSENGWVTGEVKDGDAGNDEDWQAFRWSPSNGFELLTWGGADSSFGQVISPTGIVSGALAGSTYKVGRWQPEDSYVEQVFTLFSGKPQAKVTDMTDDGAEVVGWYTATNGSSRAFHTNSSAGVSVFPLPQPGGKGSTHPVFLHSSLSAASHARPGSGQKWAGTVWEMQSDGTTYDRHDLSSLGTKSYVRDMTREGEIMVSGRAQIGGSSSYEAFVWTENDGMERLFTLGGASSEARSMNEDGWIVGHSEAVQDPSSGEFLDHAFVVRKKADGTGWDAMQGLGAPAGGNSTAFSVNNSGEILGSEAESDGTEHPVVWRGPGIWSGGGKVRLAEVALSDDQEFTVTSALSISDDGNVLAYATNQIGSTVPVLLVPVSDTDGDGMSDEYEKQSGLDPYNENDGVIDTDGDGLSNLEEFAYGTNATRSDTDRDGMPDKWEIDWGLNPRSSFDAYNDPDGDKVFNKQEYDIGTSPTGVYSLIEAPVSGDLTHELEIVDMNQDGDLLVQRRAPDETVSKVVFLQVENTEDERVAPNYVEHEVLNPSGAVPKVFKCSDRGVVLGEYDTGNGVIRPFTWEKTAGSQEVSLNHISGVAADDAFFISSVSTNGANMLAFDDGNAPLVVSITPGGSIAATMTELPLSDTVTDFLWQEVNDQGLVLGIKTDIASGVGRPVYSSIHHSPPESINIHWPGDIEDPQFHRWQNGGMFLVEGKSWQRRYLLNALTSSRQRIIGPGIGEESYLDLNRSGLLVGESDGNAFFFNDGSSVLYRATRLIESTDLSGYDPAAAAPSAAPQLGDEGNSEVSVHCVSDGNWSAGTHKTSGGETKVWVLQPKHHFADRAVSDDWLRLVAHQRSQSYPTIVGALDEDGDGDGLSLRDEYHRGTSDNHALDGDATVDPDRDDDNDGVFDEDDADPIDPAIRWAPTEMPKYLIYELQSAEGDVRDMNNNGWVAEKTKLFVSGSSVTPNLQSRGEYDWSQSETESWGHFEVGSWLTPPISDLLAVSDAGDVVGGGGNGIENGAGTSFEKGSYWKYDPTGSVGKGPFPIGQQGANGTYPSSVEAGLVVGTRDSATGPRGVTWPVMTGNDPNEDRYSNGYVSESELEGPELDGSEEPWLVVINRHIDETGVIVGDYYSEPDSENQGLIGGSVNEQQLPGKVWATLGSGAGPDGNHLIVGQANPVVGGALWILRAEGNIERSSMHLGGSRVSRYGQVLGAFYHEYPDGSVVNTLGKVWQNGGWAPIGSRIARYDGDNVEDWIVKDFQDPEDIEAPRVPTGGGEDLTRDGMLLVDLWKTNVGSGIQVPEGNAILVPVFPDSNIETKVAEPGNLIGPPQYRKVSLHGRPIADGRPQTAPESDRHREEVYVDSFTRALHYDTSLAWIPIGASELPLQVSLSYNPEKMRFSIPLEQSVATATPGFVHEGLKNLSSQVMRRGGGAFGIGFSSSLDAGGQVRPKFKKHRDEVTGVTSPRFHEYEVKIKDEMGRPVTFLSYDLEHFVPRQPSFGQKVYQSKLEILDSTAGQPIGLEAGGMVYERKYGTKLYYEWIDGAPVAPDWHTQPDATDAERLQEAIRFANAAADARLAWIEDRFGNKIRYDYGGAYSQVPIRIHHEGRDGAELNLGTKSLTLADGSEHTVVSSITDPRGHTTELEYDWMEILPGVSVPYLQSIKRPDGTGPKYELGLDLWEPETMESPFPEDETFIFDPNDVEGDDPRYRWDWDRKNEWVFYPVLGALTNANGNTYKFEYQLGSTPSILTYDITSEVTYDPDSEIPTFLKNGVSNHKAAYEQQLKIDLLENLKKKMARKGGQWLSTKSTLDKGYFLLPRPAVAAQVHTVTFPDRDNDGEEESATFEYLVSNEFPGVLDDRFGFDPDALNDSDWDNRNIEKGWGGRRVTKVTDLQGGLTTYSFEGISRLVMKPAQELFDPNPTNQPNPNITEDTQKVVGLFATELTIRSGNLANPRGPGVSSDNLTDDELRNSGYAYQETYEFDPASGMSLVRATDASGNVTSYKYAEEGGVVGEEPNFLDRFYHVDGTEYKPTGVCLQYAKGGNLGVTATDAFRYYDDPLEQTVTSKDGNESITTTYTYGGPYRTMDRITDPEGRVTVYELNGTGQRVSAKVFASYDNWKTWDPAQQQEVLADDWTSYTQFVYDESFPKFLKEKIVHATGSETATTMIADKPANYPVHNLVTEYVPGPDGRLEAEIADPGGLHLRTSYTYDKNGNKRTVELPKGQAYTTTFFYDSMNRLERTLFADSTERTYVYDSNGRKVIERDERGIANLFEYDRWSRLVRTARDMNGDELFTDGVDLITKTDYNAVGQPTHVTDPKGNTSETIYDELYRIKESKDALGHTSRFSYAGANSGSTLFNSSGFKPTRVQDVREFVTQTDYDYLYRPFVTRSEIEQGAGDWATRNLGSYRQSLTVFDKVGNARHSYAYREAGSTSNVLPTPPTEEDDDILHTETIFDALNRATEVKIEPEPGNILTSTSKTNYIANGLVWRSIAYANTPDLRRVAVIEYDAAGRTRKSWQPDPVTGAHDPDTSPMVETEYDENSNVSATINPLGHRWSYTYDVRNRKRFEFQPKVSDYINWTPGMADPAEVHPTIETRYDLAGNVEKVIDPRGTETKTDYDAANRAWKVTAALITAAQAITESQFDLNSNVVAVKDANGNWTRNAYDSLNRLVATAVNPITGDPAVPTKLSSEEGSDIVVANVYDKAGNLFEVGDGEAERVEFAQETGKWTFSTESGHVTGFTYDGLGRKLSTIWDKGSSRSKVESTTYDALLMVWSEDPGANGTVRRSHFKYDSLNRLDTKRYDNGPTHEWKYSYAGQAGTNGPGPLVSVRHSEDPVLSVLYGLDRLDRQVWEKSGGVTHTYRYDKAGNRRVTEYGGTARSLVCDYDVLNRLITCKETTQQGITDWESFADPAAKVTSYVYDKNGNGLGKTLPNLTTTSKAYDELNRVIEINSRDSENKTIARFDYSQAYPGSSDPSGYDRAGNVRRVEESYHSLPSRSVRNAYDRAYRLEQEQRIGDGHTTTTWFGYDKANNRISKDIASSDSGVETGAWMFSYGDQVNGLNSNQLYEFKKNGSVEARFSYHPTGSRHKRIKDPDGIPVEDVYHYDYENRLIQLDFASGDPAKNGTYTYGYDYRTRRVTRGEPGQAAPTTLVFSGGLSAQEWSGTPGTGTPDVEYIRGSDYGGGIGGVLYTIRNGSRSYNHYNSRGDVTARTGEGDQVDWEGAYEAYGTRTEQSAEPTERQTANTKDEDPTGLLNEWMRYRDLETGVFITRDPAGFADGPNVYSYVRQNPWTAFDPLGLVSWGGFTYKPTFVKPPPLPAEVQGGLQLIGGTAEAVVGAAGVVAPEPGTTACGLVLFTHGLDVAAAGWKKMWSGKTHKTVTSKTVSKVAQCAGMEENAADRLGDNVCYSLSVGGTLGFQAAVTKTNVSNPMFQLKGDPVPDPIQTSKQSTKSGTATTGANVGVQSQKEIATTGKVYHKFMPDAGVTGAAESKVIWGNPQTFGGAPSPWPSVQAHAGPAPAGAKGFVQFRTNAIPLERSTKEAGFLTGMRFTPHCKNVRHYDSLDRAEIDIVVEKAVLRDGTELQSPSAAVDQP